ncbi:MAG: sensor hybrid histidine kinase, partial [Tardiphaga sp.]|nr:sensor hybrid histidine kinase [Tardiphaga sp.]
MRALDWDATPIGGPARWPQSLRTAIRILLNTNHPMFLWWGPELIQFYNDAYSRTMGRERHPSALGQRGRECWAEIWPVIGPQIDQVMSGGGATWHEDQLVPVTRNGRLEQVYWTYSFSPVDENDGVGGVLVVCRDVTADHMLAAKAGEREAELARVQQIGHIGGLEVDLRTGFRNRRSPEYLALHGLSPDAANETHEDWVRRIHPDDREATEAKFKEAVKSSVLDYSAQYRIIRPNDGEVRWISVKSVIERDEDGRAVRLIGAHTDVTDEVNVDRALRKSEEEARELAAKLAELNATLEQRVEEKTREREVASEQLKATEEALRQSQKMEAVGQLTGGIAHDFNNLLNVVQGSMDLILMLSVDEVAKGRAEVARRACKQGAKLTSQLLAFSRNQRLDLDATDVVALLEGVQSLLAASLGTGIRFEVEVQEQARFVTADLNQMEMALINLAINARDAMPSGGELTIRAERAHPPTELLPPGEYVRISVIDSGAGIRPEILTKVFEPFFTTKEV